MKKKRLIVLGSTGNVGRQVLEVLNHYLDKFEVVGLLANSNVEILQKQIDKYKPKYIGLVNSKKVKNLKTPQNSKLITGQDSTQELASLKDYDLLINSVVGLAGIRATLVAIGQKKQIALANKETLVAAGELVMKEASKNNVFISPIDSEHSALLQCLNGEKRANINKMILTCSGGALRKKSLQELQTVSVQDALGHKTWSMGQKITIDSATLMNKGFEVIEAMHLYNLKPNQIDVVVHPQSIIHSMIEYSDGSIMAQLASPDMKLPIQYALSYPDRWDCLIQRFDFSQNLTFEKPDLKRFPCLSLAFRAIKEGGTLPAVMNAANDFMVNKFLKGECAYLDIQNVIKKVMDKHIVKKNITLEIIEQSIDEANFLSEKIYRKEINDR